MQEIEVREIRKSSEAFCATDPYQGRTEQTKGGWMFDVIKSKPLKKAWIEKRSLWVGGERVFTPVVLNSTFYWMDAITGTLYESCGVCKTSDILMLDVSRLRYDPAKAEKILMSAKEIVA